jgi:hypothetical protein
MSEPIQRQLIFGFGIDLQDSPSYEIMLIAQIIACGGYNLVVAGFEMAIPYFIMTAAAHFKSLCNRFEDVQKKDEKIFEDIIVSVIYHQNINRYDIRVDY